MTDQELFDTVASKLLAQGKPAADSDGICFYRDPNDSDCRCAAGHLVPDEDYDQSWEGNIAINIDWFRNHFGSQLDLIRELQLAHDLAGEDNLMGAMADPDLWLPLWKERMRTIARKNGLSVKVLNG